MMFRMGAGHSPQPGEKAGKGGRDTGIDFGKPVFFYVLVPPHMRKRGARSQGTDNHI